MLLYGVHRRIVPSVMPECARLFSPGVLMQRWSVYVSTFVIAAVAAAAASLLPDALFAQAPAAQRAAKAAPVVPVEPKPPASVKEGTTWVPPLPTVEEVAPPHGWQQPDQETPA